MLRKFCTLTYLAACLQFCTGALNAGIIDGDDSLVFSLDDMIEKGGHRGHRGHDGHRGRRGHRGHRGHDGHGGKNGHEGHRGEQGPQGIQGIPGISGPAGEQGAQGLKGDRGPKGDRGDRGHDGRGRDGKDGLPGPVFPLCCDVFVDACTKVEHHDQTGSIGAPFSSIQRAIEQAKFYDCSSCKDCRVVNILIAAGCYNAGEDEDQATINIVGFTKINLIGLGPVSVGNFSNCACQPAGTGVNINWEPTVCDTTTGIRPTLSITTLNNFADSITPYQSYANKFRLSGSVFVSASATCESTSCSTSTSTSSSSSTTIGSTHYKHHSSDKVSLSSNGDTKRKHSSTDKRRNSHAKQTRHSSDTTKDTSDTIKRKHHGHKRLRTDSGSTWETDSSVHEKISKSDGSGKRHHSSFRLHRDRFGSESGKHSSHTTSFSSSSSDTGSSSTHHFQHHAPKLHQAKGNDAEKHGKGNIAEKHGKVHGKKKVKKGVFDFFFGKKKPQAQIAQVLQPEVVGCEGTDVCTGFCPPAACADLCFAFDGCLPPELSINGEIFGGVNVTGVANLYFYKARIHQPISAPQADIVVAERTRFDSLIDIHFYGLILNSEILAGMTVHDTELNDIINNVCSPNCNSIFLQGIIGTYWCGTFTYTPTVDDGSTAPLIVDPVTNFFFNNNGGTVVGDVCNIVLFDTTVPGGTPTCGCGGGTAPAGNAAAAKNAAPANKAVAKK